MECDIFTIDALLDLEMYRTVGTHRQSVTVYVIQYAASIMNLYRRTNLGDSKHCFQCNPKITRDMNLSGSLNRLTNVLDSGDNQGIRPNTTWTNTLYESQWCDDVAEVEHVRHNHPERHEEPLSSGQRNSSIR